MKIIKKSNYRVEVIPRRLGNLGGVSVPDKFMSDSIDKDYQERCEEIAEQVERHCDNVWQANAKWDEKEVCEFCGSSWDGNLSEDNSDPEYPIGCPLCCQRAIDEFKSTKK